MLQRRQRACALNTIRTPVNTERTPVNTVFDMQTMLHQGMRQLQHLLSLPTVPGQWCQ